MRHRYSLILALFHTVTKCVQTTIIAIYQFFKVFEEKMCPRYVTIA